MNNSQHEINSNNGSVQEEDSWIHCGSLHISTVNFIFFSFFFDGFDLLLANISEYLQRHQYNCTEIIAKEQKTGSVMTTDLNYDLNKMNYLQKMSLTPMLSTIKLLYGCICLTVWTNLCYRDLGKHV